MHALGGRIVLQLWPAGAHSHPDHHGGARPAGPSAVNPGEISPTPAGRKPTVTPREMTPADIEAAISDYGPAAAQARAAGFDGVEIAANGTYLIPQFLNPRLNRRTDGYGVRRHRCCWTSRAAAAAWDGGAGVRLSADFGAIARSARPPDGGYPYATDERALPAMTRSWPGERAPAGLPPRAPLDAQLALAASPLRIAAVPVPGPVYQWPGSAPLR